MKKPINSLRHEALLNIVRTSESIDKQALGFFSRFGISKAQYNVLIVLKLEHKDLTQVEIAQRLVVSRAGITAILDKLQKKGLIERKRVATDRRIFQIGLTEEGKKIVDHIEPHYLEEVEKKMNILNEKECRQLSALLERVRGTNYEANI